MLGGFHGSGYTGVVSLGPAPIVAVLADQTSWGAAVTGGESWDHMNIRRELRRKRRYTTVSLFSGAGGLDSGLDASGRFRLLACLEVDPDFCHTLRTNRDSGRFGSRRLKVLEEDIRLFSPERLMKELDLAPGELDLLVGGPPCQAFSTAGRRRSVEDARGELLWSFLDYVVALQPSLFLMENVRGLLSAALRHRPIARRPDKGGPPLQPDEAPGSVVGQWIDDLRVRTDGSYSVTCFEVNAVNYGAPQLRERALFVGTRFPYPVDFPRPTHGPPERVEAADEFPAIYAEGRSPFLTLRDALKDLDHDRGILLDFSPRKKRYLSMVPSGGNWRALPEDVQRESMGRAWFATGGRSGWWRRLSWDLPCPTLVTMPNHASTSMCHPAEVRVLSIDEYAAVQEFPPGWEFAGTVPKQYEQAGNAVPCRLGRVAGESLASYLDDLPRPHRGATPQPQSPFTRVYLDSHVRTRRWFKGGETYVWADGADDNKRYYG